MAFNSDNVRITTLPGGNQGPGLIILHDPSATSAVIAASAYFVRATALATRNDTLKDEAVLKRYEAMAGQIRAGRGRAKRAATDVGAVLIAVGSSDPVQKKLAVSTDANGVDTVVVI